MSTSAPVVMVDDGELDDVRAVLEELGAEFAHLRGGAIPGELDPPNQLFIATPRRAMLAKDWPSGPLPIKVGVVTEDSNTLRGMLKRIGFDLLIRRPVHPYALRLVLLRALYSGSERRRDPRFPLGVEVSFRGGFRRKTATLADLSVRGARLLVDQPVSLGSRVTLQLDRELSGDKAMALRCKVVRVSDDPERDGKFVIGLQFEKLTKAAVLQLRATLRKAEEGPSVLAGPKNGEAAAETPNELPAAAPATPENRRKHDRAVFRREVVQLDEEASSVLLGRDISLGGMRIESEANLGLGDQLRLAIYGGPREDPFILRARIVRQETATTYGLSFDDLKPAVANQLESLVAKLPAVESLNGGESDALGSVVSRILERDACPDDDGDEEAAAD